MGSNCCKFKNTTMLDDESELKTRNKRQRKSRKERSKLWKHNKPKESNICLDKPAYTKKEVESESKQNQMKNVRQRQISLLTGSFAEANWVFESDFEKHLRRRREIRMALQIARTHISMLATTVANSARHYLPTYITQALRERFYGNNVDIRREDFMSTSHILSTLALNLNQKMISNQTQQTTESCSVMRKVIVEQKTEEFQSVSSKVVSNDDCKELTELEKLRAENAALRKKNKELREKLWTTNDELAKYSKDGQRKIINSKETQLRIAGRHKKCKNVGRKLYVAKSEQRDDNIEKIKQMAYRISDQRQKRSVNNRARKCTYERKYPGPVSEYRGIFETKLFNAINQGKVDEIPFEEIKYGYHNIRWPGIVCSPCSPIISYCK
uniref:uncharacterized protein LOC120327207 isoform X1 n=2 Tax=Styela clava TaxID=7725 RepID=UPI0019395DCF|nr:uncharacterized protein LOC120327207 isoform X1 [Styela clava]